MARRQRREPAERVVRRLAVVLLQSNPVETRLTMAELDALAGGIETSNPERWRQALEVARHYAVEVHKLGKHRRPWD